MAFYYYGRKKKIGKHYPEALHSTIVEPFAGSAAYSCRPEHRHRQVVLIDRDKDVVGAWKWLLGLSEDEIEALPPLVKGERTSTPIHIMHSASKRWWQYKTITTTDVMVANWSASKRWWASLLPEIRHWTVEVGNYTDAPDMKATWFVDPPYQGSPGDGYKFGSSSIDYAHLGEWCKSLSGQVIVCSPPTDTWLPFEPLADLVGVAGKQSSEGVYLTTSP